MIHIDVDTEKYKIKHLSKLSNHIKSLNFAKIKYITFNNSWDLFGGMKIVFNFISGESCKELHFYYTLGKGLLIYDNFDQKEFFYCLKADIKGVQKGSLSNLQEFVIGKSFIGVEGRMGGISLMFMEGGSLGIEKFNDYGTESVIFLNSDREVLFCIE